MQGAGAWFLGVFQHEGAWLLVLLGVVLFYAFRLHLHERGCSERWAAMDARMANVETRMDRFETKVDGLSEVVHELKGAVNKMIDLFSAK